MEWIYGINWLDVISGVIIVIAGYFIVKSIAKSTAADVLNRWVRENVTPGVGGQRSIVFPRVWEETETLTGEEEG